MLCPLSTQNVVRCLAAHTQTARNTFTHMHRHSLHTYMQPYLLLTVDRFNLLFRRSENHISFFLTTQQDFACGALYVSDSAACRTAYDVSIFHNNNNCSYLCAHSNDVLELIFQLQNIHGDLVYFQPLFLVASFSIFDNLIILMFQFVNKQSICIIRSWQWLLFMSSYTISISALICISCVCQSILAQSSFHINGIISIFKYP